MVLQWFAQASNNWLTNTCVLPLLLLLAGASLFEE